MLLVAPSVLLNLLRGILDSWDPLPDGGAVATAQHEMEVDAEVETEAERRRARPQGHRDEREASATMAAAAAAQRRVEAASERKEIGRAHV